MTALFYANRSTVLVLGAGRNDDVIRALVWRLWWHKQNTVIDERAEVSARMRYYAHVIGLPYALAAAGTADIDRIIEVQATGWVTRWN